VILTHNELVKLVKDGAIENVAPEHINGASIDITMGGTFWYEAAPSSTRKTIRLANKEAPEMIRDASSHLPLAPGMWCLAETQQVFHLPNDIAAIYVLKSSLARAGLNHLNAGYCDPGWHGSVLTMEFHNINRWHTLILEEGMKAGQMYFMRGEPVPNEVSYAVRGQYNGDKRAQPSKGVR
jgi:dCTP deaminase